MGEISRVWTNKSVLQFSGDADPIKKISESARNIAVKAIDEGWTGPPFDPSDLANRLHIKTVPNDEVPDARIAPIGRRYVLEYNPSRSSARVRYSIAHEIAHTLFPDCAEAVRNRETAGRGVGDEWQLEALCNVAAAELLMPVGSLPRIDISAITANKLIELREKFAVSTEAMAIRIIQVSSLACSMFCASRIEQRTAQPALQIDYMIASRSWKYPVRHRWLLPEGSVASHCKGVGHTWKGTERWWKNTPLMHIEAIGIPPYPGSRHARVVGLVRSSEATPAQLGITYVHGDATEPPVRGSKLIVHIVNDGTPNWGGRGFARALRKSYPDVQEQFRAWVQEHGLRQSFGRVHYADIDAETKVASMVCQKGYGPSPTPRIRYEALKDCLVEISHYAKAKNMTVHMPRIGSGEAGGRWSVVEELITSTLVSEGIAVTVYDLPGADIPRPMSYDIELVTS